MANQMPIQAPPAVSPSYVSPAPAALPRMPVTEGQREAISLTGNNLTLDQLAQAAVGHHKVDLVADAWRRIADAREVVEAFSAPDAEALGVVRIDDQMIERLHLAAAKRLLARHDALVEAQSRE